MGEIGARLREERKRLGFSQADFGQIGGVKANAQVKYEKGERFPDASYLAALAASGVDVMYVLTGQRGSAASKLSPDEEALLDNFRNTAPEQQKNISDISRALADRKGEGRQSQG